MPHPDDVDLSSISTYENFSVSFDYKYSTVNFEKFLPKGNFGQYVGYDSGAIWRIGNPGNRNGRSNNPRLQFLNFLPNLIIVLERMESYHHLSLDHITRWYFRNC
jgi:hypothetical protein